MKKELHPKKNEVEVTCTTCGKKFMIETTADEIKIDVCNECHPFYTGKQKSGSKTGRIDKFNQRAEQAKK